MKVNVVINRESQKVDITRYAPEGEDPDASDDALGKLIDEAVADAKRAVDLEDE